MFTISSTSRSHAKIISEANQFIIRHGGAQAVFIMRALLSHHSAEQLVTASEANIVYIVVKLGLLVNW